MTLPGYRPRFHKRNVEIGKMVQHVVHSSLVGGGVFTVRRMRAPACLHAPNPLARKRARADEVLGIFKGIDVVGDDSKIVSIPQVFAQTVKKSGLARSDRPAGPDFHGRQNRLLVAFSSRLKQPRPQHALLVAWI
jgi:hypothetical protein